jgi:hypothetical protein
LNRRKQCEKFVLDLEENDKDNKKNYCMQSEETRQNQNQETSKILDKNGNLVWTRGKYLQNLEELL